MIFHPEEYKAATDYWKDKDFPRLTEDQYKAILEKGKLLMKFPLKHPFIHGIINILVFAFIFASDWWVLLHLGSFIASPITAGIIVGILHAIIMYSLVAFTIHEGRAHKLIILNRGPISKLLGKIANNLGRIALAESDYYARHHLEHHAHFTTPKDGEFLLFVFPKRFFKALIPYASILNVGDFKAHTGSKYTASRIFSIGLFLLYHTIFVMLMSQTYSWSLITIGIILIPPNLAFWLDRLRQFTEHNLMPLDKVNGARDLGMGFWGLLIGGGPWGQPCHWSHHLFPGIVWYNQIRLHFYVKRLLTQEQKKFFFLKPIIGFPDLVLRAIKTIPQYAE